MTLTVDSTDVYTVTVDGTRVSVINVDGTRAWPDTYSEITAGTTTNVGVTFYGYSDGTAVGTFGSLSRDSTIGGNTIHYFFWDDQSGGTERLSLRVDGTHTQSGLFTRFRVETEDGFKEFTASGADIFNQSGGDTIWRWNDPTQLFANGNTYRWWVFL